MARPSRRSMQRCELAASLRVGSLLALSAFFGACSSVARLPAVPPEKQGQAVVRDIVATRYRAPDYHGFLRDLEIKVERERAHLRASGHHGPLPPANFLAISGGGEQGAFGAGLLSGWTAEGNRPKFNVVTGISTGALTAPFAFLGSSYDDQLKRLYTETSRKDIIEQRSIATALFGDSLADNLPLKGLVERNITTAMVEAIAQESRKGRMLLIGTTDLDAQRSVLWNLTLIAESGHPDAVALIRKILVASASIPGEMPPAMMDVEVNGQYYQEMHVDGGTTEQVFVVPPEVSLGKVARRERTFYVIRNSQLDARSMHVERDVLSIASRAISSLIQTQGIGDLYEIAASAQRDGAKLRIAVIPAKFDQSPREPFDREYMQQLFAFGYEMGRAGYPWMTEPPGLRRR